MLIDFARRTVLDEETAEDTETAHPQDLTRHACILGTLPFSETCMTTGTLCVRENAGAATRVHGHGLLDDQAVSDELADSLAWP